MTRYILDDQHNPIKCDDLFEWDRWMESADRVVARTTIDTDVRVSTVFLGLDHSFWVRGEDESNKPIVFETMIFGGPLDQYQERYATWEEAKIGHDEAVKKALAEKE